MLLLRELSITALLTFFTFTSAAVITNPPDLLLTTPDLSNTSLPANQTISPPSKFVRDSPPLLIPPQLTLPPFFQSTLPPSPYIYPIPDDHAITIAFTAYTSPLDELAAIECILSATEDVETALAAALRDGDPDPVVPQRYVRIDAEHATLFVAAVGELVKWTTWSKTLKALTAFLYRWEFVGFQFVVVEEGAVVATGALAGR